MSRTQFAGKYLGGVLPAKEGPVRVLIDTTKGVTILSGFRTNIFVPWEDITGLEVDGPDEVARRVTATRLVGLGLFAFAAKKKRKQDAYLVLTTIDGESILELSSKDPLKMRAQVRAAYAARKP